MPCGCGEPEVTSTPRLQMLLEKQIGDSPKRESRDQAKARQPVRSKGLPESIHCEGPPMPASISFSWVPINNNNYFPAPCFCHVTLPLRLLFLLSLSW